MLACWNTNIWAAAGSTSSLVAAPYISLFCKCQHTSAALHVHVDIDAVMFGLCCHLIVFSSPAVEQDKSCGLSTAYPYHSIFLSFGPADALKCFACKTADILVPILLYKHCLITLFCINAREHLCLLLFFKAMVLHILALIYFQQCQTLQLCTAGTLLQWDQRSITLQTFSFCQKCILLHQSAAH